MTHETLHRLLQEVLTVEPHFGVDARVAEYRLWRLLWPAHSTSSRISSSFMLFGSLKCSSRRRSSSGLIFFNFPPSTDVSLLRVSEPLSTSTFSFAFRSKITCVRVWHDAPIQQRLYNHSFLESGLHRLQEFLCRICWWRSKRHYLQHDFLSKESE